MSALSIPRSERIELICFAALGIVASLQWTSLVADPPAARVVLAVGLATAGGAALAAIGRLPRPRATRWALAVAACACALALSLVLVGLPARLLLPAHWGELASNIDRTFYGLIDVPVPYAGADTWTRLVILLAAPLMVAAASFAAFWPQRRRAAGRICALVLLGTLYFVAVAWTRPDRQLAAGALLVVLVCAWLWLPSIERAGRAAAGLAVAAVAVVAVPGAALVDPGRALFDYRHWDLFGAQGMSFRWDQSYGPLDWPQRGTLMLEVASDGAHYWKATNLDTFDGVRWVRSAGPNTEPALGQPLRFDADGPALMPNSEWVDRVNFEVRGLTSDFGVGAGTTLALRRVEASPEPDGIWAMNEELQPGTSYTALVYDPRPTPTDMGAAGTAYPAEASRYVSFTLSGGPDGARSVDSPFWGAAGPASIADQVDGTPYEPMYALTRRLATGAMTPYEAASRIELYLRDTYPYRQDVPNHSYPLPAFLSVDRAGYCQQFSGAMALMLRMLGIPSRVATGFSPGGRDPDRNNFLVTDTDAHNWVEVYFPGIGWVTFEPTPPAAPAATQLNDTAVTVADAAPSDEGGSVPGVPDPRRGDLPAPAPAPQALATPREDASGPATATFFAAGAGAVALVVFAAYGYRARRRARLDPEELADAELHELDRALTRLGSPLAPGTTLKGAERRLAELGGPPAARYAAMLVDRRYRDPRADPPSVSQRRALRRALLHAAGPRDALPGPGAALRVLRALPPGGPRVSRRKASEDRMTSRWARRPGPPSGGPNEAPG